MALQGWPIAGSMGRRPHCRQNCLPSLPGPLIPSQHPNLPQVYAQGMSVAAKSAECLGRVLEAALAPPAAPEARRAAARSLGPLFQKQLARVVAPAWMMATSEDQRCVSVSTCACAFRRSGVSCRATGGSYVALPAGACRWPLCHALQGLPPTPMLRAPFPPSRSYPGTRVQGVSKPPRLLCLYIDALCKACHHSAQVGAE